MDNHRKVFSGGLNADDDFSIVGQGQWVNAENIRTFTTDKGATGRMENVGGTLMLFGDIPTQGENRCIGGCLDESASRIVWALWNSNGDHGIYCYDIISKQGFKVLMNADLEGGFNFDRKQYVHSCFVSNGCFYWVNGEHNPPRRINLEAGIKAYDNTFITKQEPYMFPVKQSIISWIRKPGANPPTAIKVIQSAPVIDYNFIKDGAFQFCYRYSFRDHEFSTLSPLSILCDYNSPIEGFNRIDVTIPAREAIDQDVLAIDLIVRNVVDNSYFKIKTWDKENPDDLLEINSHVLTYPFYNDGTGEALDDAYKVKLFDSIPLFAQTCELAKNRSFFGGYIEGYDTPKETSLTAKLNIETKGTSLVTTVVGKWWLFRFNSAPNNNFYENYIISTINPLYLIIPSAPIYYWKISTAVPPYPASILKSDLTFLGSTPQVVADKIVFDAEGSYTRAGILKVVDLGETSVINTGGSGVSVLGKAFKSEASYEIGTTFYDEYQRKCGIRKMIKGLFTNEPVAPPVLFEVGSIAPNIITVFGLEGYATPLPGDIFNSMAGGMPFQYGMYHISGVSLSSGTYYLVVEEAMATAAQQVVFGALLRPKDNGPVISTPSTENDKFLTSIEWALQNTNTLAEIPETAHYYSIDITKCLTTRFFMDGVGLASYANKGVDGLYTNDTLSNSSLLLIDISGIESFGMGYSFTEGDLIKIKNGSVFTVAITGTDGKFIIVQKTDIGIIGSTNITFQIITPYKKLDTEPYYEIGESFNIVDPGLPTRKYETLSGIIGGDIYLVKRDYSTVSFVAESMSPNDKFWKQWNTNTGRINAVDTIGQSIKTQGICFSDTFIQGTKVNGLSSFSALNTESLDVESGRLRKLELASKTQSDGTVMLALCESGVASIYLGEQELFDTKGSSFIAKSSAVLGNIRSLRGGFGTKNPESVFEQNGQIGFWDVSNSSAVQYSSNGLFPVSKNKMSRASNLFSNKFQTLSGDDILALGSDPFIIGGFDPYHNDWIFCWPRTEVEPPKGYLQDYPELIYPYDIYDGKGKSVFCKNEGNIWMGAMTFEPEKLISAGNELYSFKNGALYIHNQDTTDFYGVPFKSRLMYSNNPGGIHTFLSIGLESNKKPSFVHLRTEDPYIQSSDLIADDFKNKEGVLTTSLYRDRLSPNVPGAYSRRQMTGDKLFGKALLVMVEYEFEVDIAKLQLRVSDIGNNLRSGTLINSR